MNIEQKTLYRLVKENILSIEDLKNSIDKEHLVFFTSLFYCLDNDKTPEDVEEMFNECHELLDKGDEGFETKFDELKNIFGQYNDDIMNIDFIKVFNE